MIISAAAGDAREFQYRHLGVRADH